MFKINDKYYIEKRRIRKTQFEDDLNTVKEYKEYIKADHVLQDAEYFIFVDTVDDIEYEIISNGDIVQG